MNAPTKPHCVCLSGLNEQQAALMILAAATQFYEWFIHNAIASVSGPAPLGNPELALYLSKVAEGLIRLQALCQEKAWPGVVK